MDTNSRSISQDERLGILAQDTAVLPKGVADAEHGVGSDGILQLGVTQARAGVSYPSRREAYRHA